MKLAGKKVILPFYHFVDNGNNSLTNNLYRTKNEKEFCNDLKYFKKYFSEVSISQLKSVEKNSKNSDEIFFLLSFDDGLSNFNDVVAPILKNEEISAIVFLNSDFLDNKNLFFRYKINIIIDDLKRYGISKKTNELLRKRFKQKDVNTKSIELFLKKMTLKDEQLIDLIAKNNKISFSDFLNNYKPYLTLEQVKNLMEDGFRFGAHSKSHPRYSLISKEKQIEETIDSIKCVEKSFSITNCPFSFPFSDDGVSKDFFRNEELKHRFVFGSSGMKDELSEFHYQRIPMEYKTIYSAETILKGELLYYIIKKIFKLHITKRN